MSILKKDNFEKDNSVNKHVGKIIIWKMGIRQRNILKGVILNLTNPKKEHYGKEKSEKGQFGKHDLKEKYDSGKDTFEKGQFRLGKVATGQT